MIAATVFQLLSGIFGWIWIGGWLAAIVFTAMAMFGDWSWLNVLYAAIVSLVAKWLARGFLDNRNRVAYEDDLVAKGMSPKAAGETWLNEYMGQSGQTNDRPSDISQQEGSTKGPSSSGPPPPQ